jgi:hypothetical protein
MQHTSSLMKHAEGNTQYSRYTVQYFVHCVYEFCGPPPPLIGLLLQYSMFLTDRVVGSKEGS